ncbi:hypothetical protein ADUPG1_013343 [Aduncisulcus paluster]|uniref:Uncharacterized protein n=1 Tax=Aduncisulcus paluster TaxID=2918883 RepID=A0ABQ5K2L4_9EUKA|nr:hypothetical protein ADUPG1_013343 [Aduncisulcus paluster]
MSDLTTIIQSFDEILTKLEEIPESKETKDEELMTLQKDRSLLEDKVRSLEKTIQTLEEDNAKKDAIISNQKKIFQEKYDKIIQHVKLDSISIKRDLAEIRTRDVPLKAKIKELKLTNADLLKQIALEQEKLKTSQDNNDSLAKKVEALTQSCQSFKQRETEIEAEIKELKLANTKLLKQIALEQEKLKTSQDNNDSLAKKVEALTQSCQSFKQRETEIEAEIKELKLANTKLLKQIALEQEKLKTSQDNNDSLAKKVEALTQSCQSFKQRETEIEAEIKELKLANTKLLKQIALEQEKLKDCRSKSDSLSEKIEYLSQCCQSYEQRETQIRQYFESEIAKLSKPPSQSISIGTDEIPSLSRSCQVSEPDVSVDHKIIQAFETDSHLLYHSIGIQAFETDSHLLHHSFGIQHVPLTTFVSTQTLTHIKEVHHSETQTCVPIQIDSNELSELKAKYDMIKGEHSVLKSELSELQSEYDLLKGEFGELKLKYDKKVDELMKIRTVFDEITQEVHEVKSLREKNGDLAEDNASLRQDNFKLQQHLTETTSLNTSMKSKLKEYEQWAAEVEIYTKKRDSRIDELEAENSALMHREDSLKSNNRDLAEKVSSVSQELVEKSSLLQNAEKWIKEMKMAMEKVRIEVSELWEQNKAIRTEADEERRMKTIALERVAALEDCVEKEKQKWRKQREKLMQAIEKE